MGTLRAVLDKTKLFFFFKLHILTLSSRLLETKPGVLKEMLRRFPAVFVAEEPDILSQKLSFAKRTPVVTLNLKNINVDVRNVKLRLEASTYLWFAETYRKTKVIEVLMYHHILLESNKLHHFQS